MNMRLLLTLAMVGLVWTGTMPAAAAPDGTPTAKSVRKGKKAKSGKKKEKKSKKKGNKKGKKAVEETATPAPRTADPVYFDLQEAKRHIASEGLSEGSPDDYLVDYLLQKNSKTAAALITAGADVNKPGRKGEQPLLLAARNGNPELVEHILSHGGNLNATDADGLNAMDHAARNGHLQLMEYLHGKGLAPAQADGIENPAVKEYLNKLN
ncbi:MAG: ankyrin repeat domain-containing protein [Akkermansia sp.]|nr:ankyrin repeat domain-containing protein [Akkermansia sp.]